MFNVQYTVDTFLNRKFIAYMLYAVTWQSLATKELQRNTVMKGFVILDEGLKNRHKYM